MRGQRQFAHQRMEEHQSTGCWRPCGIHPPTERRGCWFDHGIARPHQLHRAAQCEPLAPQASDRCERGSSDPARYTCSAQNLLRVHRSFLGDRGDIPCALHNCLQQDRRLLRRRIGHVGGIRRHLPERWLPNPDHIRSEEHRHQGSACAHCRKSHTDQRSQWRGQEHIDQCHTTGSGHLDIRDQCKQ